MTLARQPTEVIPRRRRYAVRLAPGVLPFFVFVVFRQSLQSMRLTAAIVVAIVVANLVNAGLNWLLIFGHWGFRRWASPARPGPRRSADGFSPILLALVTAAAHDVSLADPPRGLEPAPLWRMLRLGLPIGGQMVLEFGAFALVALMMGWLGTPRWRDTKSRSTSPRSPSWSPWAPRTQPPSWSDRRWGEATPSGPAVRRPPRSSAVRDSCRAPPWSSSPFRACWPGSTPPIWSSSPSPSALIPLAGVFQVFDGLQAVAGGILRGLGETRVAMLVNLFGYWFLGLPVSYVLGFRLGLGPTGLWWGLVIGLAVVASILLTRVRIAVTRRQERVIIDPPLASVVESGPGTAIG